jgi:uncharacterized membrane protein YdjX (TVP38/TMEM64 family)
LTAVYSSNTEITAGPSMCKPSTESGASRFTVAANRHATLLKSASLLVIVICAILIARKLPFGPVLQSLQDWIASIGLWGPIVFAILYVVAVVLMLPASPFTLIAGATFGLIGGTILASLASTTGAALTFLISRYLARERIARLLHHYPKVAAIERAVSLRGWRIVALLRLSPAVPFNLQNYLYGLTGIGFRTCVLTTWVAMLPGTFLYIYVGHAGRVGLEAASAGDRTRSPAEWVMMAVGLLATIAVTAYVARVAHRVLKEYTDIEKSSVLAPVNSNTVSVTLGWPWGATVAVMVALIMVVIAVTIP